MEVVLALILVVFIPLSLLVTIIMVSGLVYVNKKNKKEYKEDIIRLKGELRVVKEELENERSIEKIELERYSKLAEQKKKEFEDIQVKLESKENIKLGVEDSIEEYNIKLEGIKEEIGEIDEEFRVKRGYKDRYKDLESIIKEKEIKVGGIEEKITELEEDLGIKQGYKDKIGELEGIIKDKEMKVGELKKEIGVLESEAEIQEYGVYTPEFEFSTALGYKDRLADLRQEQKESIKDKTAVNYRDDWKVNGSLSEGRKMVNNSIKQILRTFNNECDVVIGKVKVSNIEAIRKRMEKAYEQINGLNKSNYLSISEKYLELKNEELVLAYHYELKKEEEKEELRLEREKEREERAIKKEIELQKKKAEKDIKHFDNMVVNLEERLKELEDENERIKAESELREMRNRIEEKEREKEELDSQSFNARAGYVYIISNIGSFGKDIVKIGVTRRLEPLERIKELSGASVPFIFDVHALVFSKDAYELESELHSHFKDYRVNKVNNRKEFFKIPIEEIEEKLEDYGNLTVNFTKEPRAEEYYKSLNS